MYPSRYQLPELTAHVLGLLERRREAFETWDAQTEAKLTATAVEALDDAGRQFAEVAQDPAYWEKTTRAIREVALPRYFAIAKDEHALEARRYGVWRGGDIISRVLYGALGAVIALIVSRTVLPKYLELLPVLLLLFGPLIPDVQVWSARRRWSKRLTALVGEMGDEQLQRERYRTMEELSGGGDSSSTPVDRVQDKTRI